MVGHVFVTVLYAVAGDEVRTFVKWNWETRLRPLYCCVISFRSAYETTSDDA